MLSNSIEKHSMAYYISNLKVTVYLTCRTVSATLKNDNQICIEKEDGSCQQVNIDSIRRMVLIGRVTNLSHLVLHRMMIKGIPVDFLDVFGRTTGQLLPDNDELKTHYLSQEKFMNSISSLELAKSIVKTKILNCREIIRRRKDEMSSDFEYKRFMQMINAANSKDSLRGIEGIAAKYYFSLWDGIVKDFEWTGRNKYPATDSINSVLSFGYCLLRNRLTSALKAKGLNPRLGFYHISRGCHAALASDLMEQFRSLVDTTVLSAIRRKIIKPEDFSYKKDGISGISGSAFPRILGLFEEMFNDIKTFYCCSESKAEKVMKSSNDIIEDCAENYAMSLQDKTSFLTWRIGNGAMFSN